MNGRRHGIGIFALLVCQTGLVGLWPHAGVGQDVKAIAGHKEAVAAVTYSPTGKLIATGSFDKTIKLWDAATLKEITTLSGHTDNVLALTFSRDGKRILSGSEDKSVKIWNLPPTDETRALPPLAVNTKVSAVSRDNKWLALGGEDGVARVFEVATGKLAREIKAHIGPISALVYSPDNARLFTAGADRLVQTWDANTGNNTGTLEVGAQPALAMQFHPNGQFLFTGDAAGQVKRWTLPLKPARPLAGHTADIVRVRVNPQGNLVGSLGADKTVRMHDFASGAAGRVLTAPAPVADFAFSPADGNLLVTVGDEKAVRVWSLAAGAQAAAREGTLLGATAVTYTPNGQGIIAAETDGTLRFHVYPFQPSLVVRPVLAHDAAITAFQAGPDGSLLLTASDDKTVKLWNEAGVPLRAFAMFAPVKFAALSPNLQLVAAIDANKEMRVWTVLGQEVKVLPNTVGPLAFSADGKWLATAAADNKVMLHPTAFNVPPRAVAAHTGAIRALAFTPQSNLVVSVGDDKVVRVTEVNAGKEIKALAGHQAGITALALSADGNQAVTGGADNAAISWDLVAGKELGRLAGATKPLTAVAFRADGTIVTASADDQWRAYRAGTLVGATAIPGQVAVAFAKDAMTFVSASSDRHLRFVTMDPGRVVGRHGGKVHAVAMTPDSRFVVSAGDDQQVRIWDATNGNPVRTLAHTGPVLALAVSADNQKVVSGGADKTCRVWQLSDGKPLATFTATNTVLDVAISRDNNLVAFTATDNLVRVHTVAGSEVQTWTLAAPRGVAFSADNKTVLFSAADKLIRANELSLGWNQLHKAPITALAVLPNGAQVAAAASDNTVITRDANNGNPLKTLAVPGPVALASAPDNVRLFVGGSDKILRMYDVNSGGVVQQFPPADQPITSLALSPDGKFVGTTDAGGAITLWSTMQNNQPGAQLAKFARPGPASACACLMDNKTLAAVGGDKITRFFETPPPAMVNLGNHNERVYAVAFRPDGLFAATGGADNNVMLWDLTKNQAAKTLSGHKAQVYSVTFSPDGTKLASSSGDKTVIIWDLAAGKPLQTLAGAQEALYQVAFTADGLQVYAAGVDKIVRVWETASGKSLKTFAPQTEQIYGLAISPNGKRLATSGYAGTVTVWDLGTAQPLHQHKLGFGAFSLAYNPSGAQLVVGNNDTKAYLLELPEKSR